MTNFTLPNNASSVKYALKSVPGLADAGVPMGWPHNSTQKYRAPAPGSGSKMAPYHIDQWEILKAWEG